MVEIGGFTGVWQSVSTDIIDAVARAYVWVLSVAMARSQMHVTIGLPGPPRADLGL